MSKVIGGLTLSLDGFVSDPTGDVSRLYPDLNDLHESEVLREEIRTTGAIIMGRHSYDMADPDSFAESYEYQVPIFVLTHHTPDHKPKETDRLTVTFVNGDIAPVVARAQEAAGERNVLLIGADINQQCLNAGLISELHCGIMPVLLGDGLRLFEHINTTPIQLEKIRMFEHGARTDLWFRVIYTHTA